MLYEGMYESIALLAIWLELKVLVKTLLLLGGNKVPGNFQLFIVNWGNLRSYFYLSLAKFSRDNRLIVPFSSMI